LKIAYIDELKKCKDMLS